MFIKIKMSLYTSEELANLWNLMLSDSGRDIALNIIKTMSVQDCVNFLPMFPAAQFIKTPLCGREDFLLKTSTIVRMLLPSLLSNKQPFGQMGFIFDKIGVPPQLRIEKMFTIYQSNTDWPSKFIYVPYTTVGWRHINLPIEIAPNMAKKHICYSDIEFEHIIQIIESRLHENQIKVIYGYNSPNNEEIYTQQIERLQSYRNVVIQLSEKNTDTSYTEKRPSLDYLNDRFWAF